MRALAVACCLLTAVAPAAAAPRVVVVTAEPGADTTELARAVAAAGAEPVAFDGAPADGERDARFVAAGQQGLDEARTAYLEQRFDDMVYAVERAIASDPVAATAPRHRALLWDLAFQLGLAHHARGDAVEARRWFALALTLDADRRPERELYGPDVLEQFTAAMAARAELAARPLRIAVEPPDAVVVIDGVPVVARDRARAIVPGLHAVRVSAPGYEPEGQLVELTDSLELRLAPATGEPADLVASARAAGELRAAGPSTQRLLRALATALGVQAVLLVRVDGDGATAWLIGARAASAPQRAATPGAAAAAALAWLAPDGAVREPVTAPVAAPAGSGDDSVLGSWWFWSAVGVAVIGAVVLGTQITDDAGPPRIHIVETRP